MGLLVALSGAGCDGEARARQRSEAGRVSSAVDRLREAPPGAKRSALDALRRERCSTEDVCALQSECVAAYQRQLRATEAVRSVRDRLVADGGPTGDLGVTLATAERDLEASRPLAKRCVERQGEVVRRYRP
jgi:hypothetical protein